MRTKSLLFPSLLTTCLFGLPAYGQSVRPSANPAGGNFGASSPNQQGYGGTARPNTAGQTPATQNPNAFRNAGGAPANAGGLNQGGAPTNGLSPNGGVPNANGATRNVGSPGGQGMGTAGQGNVMQPNSPQGPAATNSSFQQAPVQPAARNPLPPDQQKYISEVLLAWQNATAKITRYSTKFHRWQFNPALTNDNIPHTRGSGELRYMKPDKGMFKVEQHEVYTQERDANKAPVYKQFPNQSGEWWLCDGDSVFKFERDEKSVYRYPLPPNMKGMQIAESPLPFVFGIEAEKMMQRYWVEIGMIPNGPDGKPRQDLVVIDAYPKRADDASNYQKVTVFLDRNKILPVGLIIYEPTWSPQNPCYEHFEFFNSQVNDSLIDKIKDKFMESFIPNPPRDFKIIDMPFQPGADDAPGSIAGQPSPAAQPNSPGQRVAAPPIQPGNRQ